MKGGAHLKHREDAQVAAQPRLRTVTRPLPRHLDRAIQVPSSYRRAGPQRGIACEALARLPPPCCVRVLFLSARVPLASPPEPGCRLPNGIRHGTASRVDGGGSREPTLFLLPAFGVTDGALCAIWARFLASVAAVAALASVATVSCCPPPPLMIMMMPSLPSSLAHTAGCWLLAAGCWLRAAAA